MSAVIRWWWVLPVFVVTLLLSDKAWTFQPVWVAAWALWIALVFVVRHFAIAHIDRNIARLKEADERDKQLTGRLAKQTLEGD